MGKKQPEAQLVPGDVETIDVYAWRIVGGARPDPELWRIWFEYYWPDSETEAMPKKASRPKSNRKALG